MSLVRTELFFLKKDKTQIHQDPFSLNLLDARVWDGNWKLRAIFIIWSGYISLVLSNFLTVMQIIILSCIWWSCYTS